MPPGVSPPSRRPAPRPRAARRLALAVVAAALLSQCDRAPAEPVPAASARPKEAPRCLRPTSETPPAPVPKGPDPACPKDPDGAPPAVPMSRVSFPDASAPAITVETMSTEPLRNRGLMYRRALADDRGMLFVFPDSRVRTFWMHNTCLPLDMLFIAADGYVTGILENVPTMNDDGRSIPCAAKYVLEVNAGFSRKHGVRAGQTVRIEGP